MPSGKFRVKSGGVLNSEIVFDSRKDELLVLIAIMDAPNRYSSAEEIAEVTKISKARATAAIALYTEAGIIMREGDVSYEFEPKEDKGSFKEISALEAAEDIRNSEIAELFAELGTIMNKDLLIGTDESKRILGLVTELGLSTEYIIMLAEYLKLKSKKPLDALKLYKKAETLLAREVDTTDKLENYIKKMENDFSLEWDFRHTFKMYNRAPFDYELDLYRKWTETYGFSSEVIRLAIEINVRSHVNYSYPYLDTLLSAWHEGGCRTLEECEAKAQKDGARISEKYKGARTKKSEAPKPTYGDFDANEALERAIAKSFAAFSDEENKGV